MQKAAALGIKPTERALIVRISTQTLQFYRSSRLEKSYVISTSLRPPSNIKGSLGTPKGLHAIAERIGAGQPPGMVFKSRVPTGRHFNEFAESESATSNLVTTRILWLRGLEAGVNAGGDIDSYDRYIYIHGTNHEDRIGEPQSGGCVLMRNLEIIELYDEVRSGDLVLISD
ncbi:MAG TPA: L,D-transpeptidase [Opitutaceae bacterium]